MCAQSHRKQDSLVLIVEFQNVKCSVTAAKNALVPWQRDWLSVLLRDRERGYIESFHAHGQLACKFIGTKERVYIRTEFSSQRTDLRHQNGFRQIIWKHSIYNWRPPSKQHGFEKYIYIRESSLPKPRPPSIVMNRAWLSRLKCTLCQLLSFSLTFVTCVFDSPKK